MADKNTPIHYAETKYGFEYGSAKLDRLCSDNKKGWIVLGLCTPKHKNGISIYVTKTGKVRIHDNNKEWIPK